MARALIVLEDDEDGSVCFKASSPTGQWSETSDAHKLAYTLAKHFETITGRTAPEKEGA